MKYLAIFILLVSCPALQAQCSNGVCVPTPAVEGPHSETTTYTGTMSGAGCCSKQLQRIGNRTYFQVGLFNVLQGMSDTAGSKQSASIGKQRNRTRIRLFRRFR